MAYLQRNSYFKDLSGSEVFEGQPHKIDDLDYTSLRISVQTDVSGSLTVLQSLDGYTWNEFNDTFAISSTSHKQVEIKGRYVYVMYENGAAIASPFQLYSVLSKSGVSSTGVVGLQEVLVVNDSLAVTGLNFDASGNLKVAGISGGGTSSDVNITNALLSVKDASAIEQMTIETDRLLYDLDVIANRLHDISGSVEISNQITGFATSAKQDSMLSDLDQIVNRLHDISGSLEVTNFPTLQMTKDASAVELLGEISHNTATTATHTFSADFDTFGELMWADSTNPWTNPTDGQEGWEYFNYLQGGAQVYYYGNSPALTPNSQEPNITLGSVLGGWMVGNQKLITNTANRWIMAIYTQPSGSGDAQPWYKSRRSYRNTTFPISKGCDYLFYWGQDPVGLHPELTHIELSLASSAGTQGDNEIVQFMAVAVGSEIPEDTFNGILKEAGHVDGNGIRQVLFKSSQVNRAEQKLNQLKFETAVENVGTGNLFVKDVSAVALLQQIADGIVVDVGEVDISGVSVVDEKLSVHDVSANSELSSIRQILGDIILTANYGLLNDTPTYAPIRVDASGAMLVNVNNQQSNVVEVSGSVVSDLSGASFTDSKLNVYDASCELVLEDIKTQTDKLAFYNEGTFESLRVRVENPSSGGGVVDISGVGVYEEQLKVIDINLNTQLAQFSFITDESEITDLRTRVMGSVEVINPDGVNLSVTESNPITGFALETTLADIKTQTDKMIFDIKNEETTGALIVRVDNLPSQPYSVEVSGFVNNKNYGYVSAEDIWVGLQATDGGVLKTDITNSSVDTHLYGLHNSTWTAVNVAANGHLLVNSSTQDGDGNDITSTAVSGTETYRALDVKCRGTTSVSGGVSATLYTTAPLTSTLSGSGNSINSLDVAVKNDVAVKSTQYGSFGNLANNVPTILPAGVTSGIDVSAWSYFVGAYQDFYSGVAPTGSLRLQYSFDNTTYYDLFNTTINPSGVGTPRTANIQKQDIPAINWIRFKNDTTQTMSSVTITLLGASLS